LNPNLQEKLTRLASEQGRDSEALVVEAVERLVNYDEWFLQEVEKGLAAADRGEFVDHEDVKNYLTGGSQSPEAAVLGGRISPSGSSMSPREAHGSRKISSHPFGSLCRFITSSRSMSFDNWRTYR